MNISFILRIIVVIICVVNLLLINRKSINDAIQIAIAVGLAIVIGVIAFSFLSDILPVLFDNMMRAISSAIES